MVFGDYFMVENIQNREEATWEELRQKARQRHQSVRKRAGVLLPALLIILGILCVVICGLGFYAAAHYLQPLTLPDSVQIQPLTAADQLSLQASDFVLGLEDTGIQVSFGKEYDPNRLGQQEVSLVFTRGNEICTQTASLYRFRLEPSWIVKLGQESGVDVRDFVPDETVTASFVTSLEEGKSGTFTLQLLCGDREYEVECVVTEDIPPRGEGKEVTVEAGTIPEPSVFVDKIVDHTTVRVTYKQPQSFIHTGRHSLVLVLTDLFGNTAEVEATANVIPAANGPQFSGLETLYLELGTAVSYRTGVTATDAQDGTLSFTVDSNGFNSQIQGCYTVYYSATDSDGNKLIMPRTIVVESHTGQLVREKAQEVLDQIIKPGMTQDEKIYAVFRRVRNYMGYASHSDKSSVENAAYEGFSKWYGDCYTYYAMVRVMLDMLEIPNLEVARVDGKSNHWWNLVQFEDGKYYHIDAIPHQVTDMEHFKMTESVIVAYTNNPAVARRRPNYYVYDHTLPEYQNIEIAQ